MEYTLPSQRMKIRSIVLILLTLSSLSHVSNSQTTSVTANGKMTTGSSITTTVNFTNAGSYDAGNSTMILTGNWTNSGTFTAGTSTVKFNGTGAQTISNTGTGDFNNVTVDKSTGILSLSTDATINGTLTLTNGLFSIGSNTLTLGTSASVSGTPSATKMIVVDGSGVVKKMFSGTGSFTYPVGDNTGTAEYSPATLNFTGGTFSSASASVRLVDAKHPNNTSSTHYISRYWNVTTSGITNPTCGVTFTYVDADINGTEGNIWTAKYDAPNWDLLNAANAGTNQLTGTVTGFSDFTGGEQTALPVELISFSASLQNRIVRLKWKTATEVNNYGFEIERSTSASGKDWMKIGFVEGTGTSNTPRNYDYNDQLTETLLRSGKVYYRLHQLDRDGAESYSNVVEVHLRVVPQLTLDQAYPNPISRAQQRAMITFTLPNTNHVRLTIIDYLGKEVALIADEMMERGMHRVSYQPSSLPSGMYRIILRSGSEIKMTQIVVVK